LVVKGFNNETLCFSRPTFSSLEASFLVVRGVCHRPWRVEKLLLLRLPSTMWLKILDLSYKMASFSSIKEGRMHRDMDRKQSRVA